MARFDVYDEQGTPVSLADLPGSRVLAGEPDPPPLIVRNIVRERGRERWLRQRATGLRDTDGRVVWAIDLIEDISEAKRSEIAQSLLAEAARVMAASDDVEHTLQALARAAVPGLADWAGVDLAGARGELTTVAVAHRDPEKVRLGWWLRSRWPVDPDAPSGLQGVVRTGVSQSPTAPPAPSTRSAATATTSCRSPVAGPRSSATSWARELLPPCSPPSRVTRGGDHRVHG